MAYQLLGVRSFPKKADDGSTKYVKFDAFFEKRWRFENPEDIYTRPVELLNEMGVPETERFNLYYTVPYCDDTKRGFKSQVLIAIDIDDIDHSRIDEYAAPVCSTLGVTPSKVAVVSSGGGLHFILKLEKPITDAGFFEMYRPQFKALCKMIDRELEAKGLRGKPDPSVFEPRRILRMPGTVNRKDGRGDRPCVVLSSSLVAVPFDLEKLTGLKRLGPDDALTDRQVRRMRQADGNAAFEQCKFLAHCKENPAAISEPEWYAAASIVGRFKGGREQFHEISSAYPGYSKNETDLKFDQAVENSGPRTCKNINALWGGCHACPHFEKITSPVVIYGRDVIPTESTGFYDVIVTKQGEKSIPNYNDLMRAYCRDHEYRTAPWLKTVLEWNGKKYVDKTPLHVKAFAEKMFSPKPLEKNRNEFLAKVLANRIVDTEWFAETTEGRINFQNGVLDLKMENLLSHSPEFGFRWVLPYDYTPGATAPRWEKFIDEVTLGDKDLAFILQEFVGYIVSGSVYKHHKALWISGGGANGKSTFINIVKDLIGRDSYAVVSIKQIVNDKFASAELDGKLANFCEETSPEDLSDSGPFKNLTGEGEVSAQKKYGASFQFVNRAKLVMSYNEIPKLRDLTEGMLRRPLIVPFDAHFPEGSRDKGLRASLVAELPGIFNWSLAGWKRLEEQGEFTFSQKSKDALGVVRVESDPIEQWVRDFVTFEDEGKGSTYTTRLLYEFFRDTQGRYCPSFDRFSKRLGAHPDFALRAHRADEGRGARGYKSLTVRASERAAMNVRGASRGEF